jgi:4-amino-4-deoxy-L-arabinose transferase-like glycosyltransferase
MNVFSKQTGRLDIRALIILIVLGSVFFTFMIGNRALSVPDEGRYVEIPREMVATGDYLTPRLNGVKYFEKPVLFYWLEAFSIKLFGLQEFTLRLWPALLALMGCLAIAIAGSRLYDRLTGFLAAIILGTSLLYYAMSRAIILDMPVSILITISLLFFLLGTHEPTGQKRRFLFWGFYAFAALAVLTKGLIGLLIPGMVIGAWIVLLGEWRLLKTMYLPTGFAVFLLIAAPWHIMVGLANPEFFHFYFIHEHFERYLTTVHSRYQPAWFFIPIVLAGLFPWSVFLFQAIKHSIPSSWRERHEHRDALFLLLWAGLVFLFFSASSSKLVPYILPIFPPIALLIGRYLAATWEHRAFPGVKIGYAALMAVTVLLAAGMFILPLYWPKPEDIQTLSSVLGTWRTVLAITLVVGGVAAWGLAQFSSFQKAFIAVSIMSALLCIQINAAAPLVDTKSVKDLAMILKAHLQPGDEVSNYEMYYQDLPVYLERRITIAGWKGELEFGTTVEDTSAWMVDGATFFKRWKSPSTMYMMTTNGAYDVLRKNAGIKMVVLGRNTRNILVVNKEVKKP